MPKCCAERNPPSEIPTKPLYKSVQERRNKNRQEENAAIRRLAKALKLDPEVVRKRIADLGKK
jgi:hypothetical protein